MLPSEYYSAFLRSKPIHGLSIWILRLFTSQMSKSNWHLARFTKVIAFSNRVITFDPPYICRESHLIVEAFTITLELHQARHASCTYPWKERLEAEQQNFPAVFCSLNASTPAKQSHHVARDHVQCHKNNFPRTARTLETTDSFAGDLVTVHEF